MPTRHTAPAHPAIHARSVAPGRAAPAPAPTPAAAGTGPVWIDGFLAPEQCAAILDELRWAFWTPSTVVARAATGGLRARASAMRVSESTHETWFSEPLVAELRALEVRIAAAFGIRPERCEPWQATRYRRGGSFDYHHDSGHWGHEPAGEREWTLLLHLRAPTAGGSTHFRALDVDVPARAGRLVVWRNLLPGGARDPAMLHAGMPVDRGTKTVLVTWARQRDVRGPASPPPTQEPV